jgi:methionyl aminopeptidase
MPRTAEGYLVPGKISPKLSVPASIKKPEYVGKPGPSKNNLGDKYSAEEITKIRKASKLAAEALEVVCDSIKPGVTTDKLDQIGHEFLIRNNAYPSTLGYRGFPKSLCTSLNEVICHGIPDDTIIEEGDIVNIDITAFIDGFHGDNNKTVTVGEVDPAVKDLVTRTEEALNRGIKAALPGREVNIIGRAIETYAKRFDYGVVREFTGHGVGRAFHTGLIIPHYDSQEYKDIIEPGMVFTIEPMLTLGSAMWDMWEDDWTVTTDDKSFSAQFEHTILITESGPEILTVTA